MRARTISDISDSDWEYVWADLPFLKENPHFLQQLLEQDKWQVLVPYDTQEALQQSPIVRSGSRLIPLQKPLIWHTFTDQITVAGAPFNNAALARTVRFAPQVDVVNSNDIEQPQEATAKDSVILLVEDNPV